MFENCLVKFKASVARVSNLLDLSFFKNKETKIVLLIPVCLENKLE